MNNNYIEFDGRVYAIDMDKFMKFVSVLPANEKDVDTTITQVYGKEQYSEYHEDGDQSTPFDLMTKEVTESKSNNNDVFNNLRYDFARSFLNILISPTYNADGSVNQQETEDDFLFGQKLAFNTLLYSGILIDITNIVE